MSPMQWGPCSSRPPGRQGGAAACAAQPQRIDLAGPQLAPTPRPCPHAAGIINALTSKDYVCSTYRDHVHALSKGVSAREVMAELFGKATGCCRGQVGGGGGSCTPLVAGQKHN